MPEEKVLLTAEGLEKLKSELENLLNTRRPQVLEKLQRSKEFTDVADSAEYEDAKNEQAFLEGRIKTVEKMIRNAEVVSSEKARRPSRVEFGTTVTVLNQNGEEKEYTIVGKAETDPRNGKISHESPVGKALLGKHVGEEVEVEAPKGTTKYRVLAIYNQKK
ncbi:MAG: transcription elongation factor GreA [Dehalococcoidia bacterium]